MVQWGPKYTATITPYATKANIMRISLKTAYKTRFILIIQVHEKNARATVQTDIYKGRAKRENGECSRNLHRHHKKKKTTTKVRNYNKKKKKKTHCMGIHPEGDAT